MSLCASCGTQIISGDRALCAHHDGVYDSTKWADRNRVWCDYFHRRVPIPRLAAIDREEDVWAGTPAADV